MTSSIPPYYVVVPVGILYNLGIPPEIRDTYAQLLGLAYQSADRPPKTPALTAKEIEKLTGKKRTTLWGHMTYLRDRGTLRWTTAQGGGLIVELLVFHDPNDPEAAFKILNTDTLNILPINQIDSRSGGGKGSGVQNFEQVRRSSLGGKAKETMPVELLRRFVNVLASVYIVDCNLNYGRLAAEAKRLYKAGYTPEQVQQLYQPCKDGSRSAWYEHDWRGRKGEAPQMGIIPQTIALLLNPPKREPMGNGTMRENTIQAALRKSREMRNGNKG